MTLCVLHNAVFSVEKGLNGTTYFFSTKILFGRVSSRVAKWPRSGCTARNEVGRRVGIQNLKHGTFFFDLAVVGGAESKVSRFSQSVFREMHRIYRCIQNISICPSPCLCTLLLSSYLPAMPTLIFWKTFSLALLTIQTVRAYSDFLNTDSSFSITSPDDSGSVGSPMADGSINEPLQYVPDVQRDSNLLLAEEKYFCANTPNQIQVPRRRRSRAKRQETCASELNGNTQSQPKGQQPAAPNVDQTGSTPVKKTNAEPGKIPSRWLDLPKDPKLCGPTTGLAQIPVCHPGYPKVESYALWLQNIRPCK